MNNGFLILIMIILFLVWILCFENERFTSVERTIPLQDIYNDVGLEDNALYEIGEDESGLSIYKYNGNTYTVKMDELKEIKDPVMRKTHSSPIRIPAVITSKKIKSEVPLKFQDYKYRGVVANKDYKQYYILYEKEYDNQHIEENKMYYYVLVKRIDNEFQIVHDMPPRVKVEEGDSIYFSFGNFQIGPLKFI